MNRINFNRHASKLSAARRALSAAMLVVSAALISSSSAAAQPKSVRVTDSILGIRLGSTLEEAREKLKGLVKTDGADRDEREAEREGGRKEAWALKQTAYATIAYGADKDGRIQWVTGFVRAGHEIPFAKVGDLTQASHQSGQAAIWNVQRPGGNIRVIARGAGGKARVVQVLSLNAPPVP